MKKCSDCQKFLPLENFSRKGSGLQSKCKECNKAYYKQYYQNNPKEKARILANNKKNRKKIQEVIDAHRSVPCTDCGIQYPPYIMQFDHLDDKLFNIGGSKLTKTLVQIEAEIAKCEVVCANCHAERTHQRLTGVGYAGIAR